ncbi:MAG: UDP-N-acetylmuramoyl-tripeptide--D-alanyl-D-alanine ligase [Clostridium sp.]
MELTFKELIEAVNGELIIENENKSFNKLSIDTRKIQKDNVYLAIKGSNFNGNDYTIEALKKGASIAIIDEVNFEIEECESLGNVIKVNNTKEALLSLAKYYRNKLGLKVIGVTGSTGKTSTKDLLAAFLSGKYNVFKTKGNFNNDIGLPLMVLELNSEIDVAILEMGMSDLGEIHTLAKVASPDIGVITNIGLSHIENLKTQDNILKAKMEITDFFDKDNILIINGEDKYLNTVNNKEYKIIKTGLSDKFEIYASDVKTTDETTKFTCEYNGKKEEFTLPMIGAHNVLNGLLGIGVSLQLELTFDEMRNGISNLEATSMRLEIIKGNVGRIINDCYNASPDSMRAALDVLNNSKGRKVAILGTMRELGSEAKTAHKETGEYATSTSDVLIVCGEYQEDYKEGYNNKNIYCFENKEELINALKTIIKGEDNVLVKASRGEKFEEIVVELKKIIV